MKKRSKTPFDSEAAKRAVIRVGDGGRGFVVEIAERRIVVTAAHCLPHLPPAHPWAYLHEKTYAGILAPLQGTKPTLTAECTFVDPVADIAVLTEPDSQELSDDCEVFRDYIDACTLIRLSQQEFNESVRAWLLSLDGRWEACRVTLVGTNKKTVQITDAKSGIAAGMSGSPIVLDDGTALGLVSTTNSQPRLIQCLPVWLVNILMERRA